MSLDEEPLGAALFDAYPAPRVAVDLADRVLAPRRRRSPAWGVVAAGAVLAALLIARHRPPSQGLVIASSRTVIALAPDVDAVAEAGAILAWNGRHVRQLAGRVFYQTRGASLEVGTPSALVVDIGTKFEVEVRPMKKALVVAGAVVLLFVVVREGRVLVHNEAGRVEVAAGETAHAAPGVAPSRVASSSAPVPDGEVRRLTPMQRRTLEAAIRAARTRRQVVASPAAPVDPVPVDETEPAYKDALRRTVREVLPLVSECYTLGLERDPTLRGTVVLSFRIVGEPDVGGLVEDAAIIDDGSTLADPEVRECIIATISSLQFPPPEEGGEIFVGSYPFAFLPEAEGGQAPPEKP